LEVNSTVPVKRPLVDGLKRTVTSRRSPAFRVKELFVTTLKGSVDVAVPARVPSPVFCTVKLRSLDWPTLTLPKVKMVGVTVRRG
jgi:hypothetical protein